MRQCTRQTCFVPDTGCDLGHFDLAKCPAWTDRSSPDHTCPRRRAGIAMPRTLRAERVEINRAGAEDPRLPERVRAACLADAEQNEREMDERGLCRACGYPLDGSYPHPDSEQARFERRDRNTSA